MKNGDENVLTHEWYVNQATVKQIHNKKDHIEYCKICKLERTFNEHMILICKTCDT